MATQLDGKQLQELLYQGLETELGGVEVYTTAVRCAVNSELGEEWKKYLQETKTHVEIMKRLLENLGMDVETQTPGRKVVRHIGTSLVKAMEMALAEGPKEAAELVAAECVVHAETKDHLNWELLGVLIEQRGAVSAEVKKALREAFEQVEEQEDEHLYHTTGWTRELWIQSLGLAAVLPPPEEEKEVKTAIGAARAKKARKELL
jgi:hypothetical protein